MAVAGAQGDYARFLDQSSTARTMLAQDYFSTLANMENYRPEKPGFFDYARLAVQGAGALMAFT